MGTITHNGQCAFITNHNVPTFLTKKLNLDKSTKEFLTLSTAVLPSNSKITFYKSKHPLGDPNKGSLQIVLAIITLPQSS